MNFCSLRFWANRLPWGLRLAPALLVLASCGGINDSWESKGGGYFKYSVGDSSYSIELARRDVEPPFVNNSHHYFYFKTQLDESKRGDQFALLVNSPTTGKKLTPVSSAPVNGKMQVVTWMRYEGATQAPLITDKSYIKFDEIIRDSIWTADVDLYFKDCRSGTCKDDLPPIHVTGRLRYWVSDDDR